jgi:hypothetical protein
MSKAIGVQSEHANFHPDKLCVQVFAPAVAMPFRNLTKGQHGQIHDDRRLSVPELSATTIAAGFESCWDCDTFGDETSHC